MTEISLERIFLAMSHDNHICGYKDWLSHHPESWGVVYATMIHKNGIKNVTKRICGRIIPLIFFFWSLFVAQHRNIVEKLIAKRRGNLQILKVSALATNTRQPTNKQTPDQNHHKSCMTGTKKQTYILCNALSSNRSCIESSPSEDLTGHPVPTISSRGLKTEN